jgi:hypothetical protein
MKPQFGFVKVRYYDLVKNTGQIVTLFALANLWMERKRLLPLLGEVRPSQQDKSENRLKAGVEGLQRECS